MVFLLQCYLSTSYDIDGRCLSAVAKGSRSACREHAVSALQHSNAGMDVHSSARQRDLEVPISAVPIDRQCWRGGFFQNSNRPLTKLTDLVYYWSVEMKNAEAEFQVNHVSSVF